MATRLEFHFSDAPPLAITNPDGMEFWRNWVREFRLRPAEPFIFVEGTDEKIYQVNWAHVSWVAIEAR